MYSAVLMTMLTVGGAESTGFGWRHHGHGCHGWGCHACYGCHGCYGCWGCHGCWGCYGGNCYGGYAGYYYGCWSCWGAPISGPYHACVGCMACTGCYGGVVIVPTTTTTTDTGSAPRTKEEAEVVRRVLKELRERKTPPSPPPGEETTAPAAARLTVRVPADARLWVDDSFCPLTDEVRTFSTPKLETGRQYYYTLRLEVQRDGQTLVMSRRVFVAAGQTVNVDMNDLSTATVRR